MMDTVIEFPHCDEELEPCRPFQHDTAAGEVITFPSRESSLTAHDLDALDDLIASAHSEWDLEISRDFDWNVIALLAPHDCDPCTYTAFLVCRRNGRLILRDARISACWRTLGDFADVEALMLALRKVVV